MLGEDESQDPEADHSVQGMYVPISPTAPTPTHTLICLYTDLYTLYPTLYHADRHDDDLKPGLDTLPLNANVLLSKLETEVNNAVKLQLEADKKQEEIKILQAKARALAEAKEAKEQDEHEDKNEDQDKDMEDPEVDLTGTGEKKDQGDDADVEMDIDGDKDKEKKDKEEDEDEDDKKKEKKDKDEDKDDDKDDKNDDEDELDAVEVKDPNGTRRTFNAIPVVDAPTFKEKLDENVMSVCLPLPEVHNISSQLIPSSFPVHSQNIQLIPSAFPEHSQHSIHMYRYSLSAGVGCL